MDKEKIFEKVLEKYYGNVPNDQKPDWAKSIASPVKLLVFDCMNEVEYECEQFYCLSDPSEGGIKRCKSQCKGCENSENARQ